MYNQTFAAIKYLLTGIHNKYMYMYQYVTCRILGLVMVGYSKEQKVS